MLLNNIFKRFTLIIILFLAVSACAGPDKKIDKTFDQKDKVKIKLALSDCIVTPSNDTKIHALVDYSYPDDQYEVVFKESGSSITMQEKFYGEDADGSAQWNVQVPKGVDVDIDNGTGDLILTVTDSEVEGNTGTGDVELTDSSGEFELNSGTGSVVVKSCNGDFDLNSGTGSVKMRDSEGNFKANSGTGNVEAHNLTFSEDGDFNSGTGDVEITGPKGEDYDLSLNSGTGDAVLDMDGAELVGFFEFRANSRSGRIKANLDFDREEEHGDSDRAYMVKSVTLMNGTPRFFVGTGTGTAQLKK